MALSGAVVIGFIVDNLSRPSIIKLLSKKYNGVNTLDHTLITVLSTLAGISMLGLFIGPIIAAMAVSIFDIYSITYNKDRFDSYACLPRMAHYI